MATVADVAAERKIGNGEDPVRARVASADLRLIRP
jgi:hypothetical protein